MVNRQQRRIGLGRSHHRGIKDVLHASGLGRRHGPFVLFQTMPRAIYGIGAHDQQAVDSGKALGQFLGRLVEVHGTRLGSLGHQIRQGLGFAAASDNLIPTAASQQKLDDAMAEMARGSGDKKSTCGHDEFPLLRFGGCAVNHLTSLNSPTSFKEVLISYGEAGAETRGAFFRTRLL